MMDINKETSKLLYKKIEELNFFIRRSPKELVATFFAVVCFVSGQWLYHESNIIKLPSLLESHQDIVNSYKPFVGVFLFILTIALIAWVSYCLWKIALPPIHTDSNAKLSHAIKGLMAFNAEDSELFSKLERQHELAELCQYINNPQRQIVVLMGESGAGKTSLLRAGLTHLLESEQSTYIYWEAFPDQAVVSLLETINSHLNTQYHQLDEVLTHNTEAVIVLDQFEQLSVEQHPDIFALLTAVIKHHPPHKLTWVVAFRREYDPEWRDFELSLGDYRLLPMLSLKLFSKAQAQNVFTILASEAGLILDQVLVDSFMTSMQHKEQLSPVDISIGLLMLSELASQKQKTHLTLEDYQFAGGSEGLFVKFINAKLERFSEIEKQALLKALLELIDLNGYKRIAEGRSLQQLIVVAELPERQLVYALDYFASSHVRLLEKLPNGFYRLPHETIIPALRRLTGLVLAEAEQAELKLKTAYEAWQKSSAKNAVYLLKGKELRQVLKYLPQIAWQAEEKEIFIKQCKQKRNRLRLLGCSFVLLLSLSGFYGWQAYLAHIHRIELKNWGLPADLYDYQSQLEKLVLRDYDVVHLHWLKKLPNLTELALTGVKIINLNDITENLPALTILHLYSTDLSSLQGLKNLPALTTLNLSSNSSLSSLQGLKNLPALTTLNLSGNFNLSSLQGLENLPALTTLDLSSTSLSSLQGLEKFPTLTTLDLSGNSLNNLQGLKNLPALTTLNLRENYSLSNLQGSENLPALTTLNLTTNSNLKSLQGLENFPALTTLDLSGNTSLRSLQSLEKIPALTLLNLENTRVSNFQELGKLSKLTTLNLSRNPYLSSLQGLDKLPALTTLDLGSAKLNSLQGLENLPALTTLNLSLNYSLSSLQGLENLPALKTLNLSGNPNLSSLQGLEKFPTLTTLDLRGNSLNNLQGLEKLSALTTLDLRGNSLNNLQGLEKLSAITTLDLSKNTSLSSLQGLKKLPALTTLNLEDYPLNNLQSLEKLPALTTLNLRDSYSLINLQGLENLSALMTLDLSGNTSLSSLQGLENLPTLTTLNLSYKSSLISLQGLENLPALTTLNLSNNSSLSNLQGLGNFSALTTLDLSGNTSLSSLQSLEKLPALTLLNLSNTPPFEKLERFTKIGNRINNRKLKFFSLL